MRIRLRSTILLVLITLSLAIGITAVADGGCDNPIAHKVCAAARDGNLRVGLRERITSDPKTTKVGLSPRSGTTDADTWNRMGAAFCADAGVEAASAGGATRRSVEEAVSASRERVPDSRKQPDPEPARREGE